MNIQQLPATFPLLQPQTPVLPSSPVRQLRMGILSGSQADSSRHLLRHLTDLGVQASDLADDEAMLARCDLDAVAICSPERLRRQHLRAALSQGLHVLAEKPLVLEAGRDPVSDARPLVEGFAASRKVLMLNEPWPFTLPVFDELYPQAGIFSNPPEHLAMLLCSAAPGIELVIGGVPHALSLLYALCPSGGVAERIRVEPNDSHDGVATALTVSFQYTHCQGRTNVSVDLCHMPQSPRPAGYAIDGQSVRRIIESNGNQQFFVTSDTESRTGERPLRRVPIADPLRLLLLEFQRRVTAADQGVLDASQADATLLERLGLLRTIEAVARRAITG